MKRFALALVVLAMAVLLSGCIVTSEGESVGTVSVLTHKGLFIKTWEGSLILGGSGASGNRDNTWYFSVERPEVVEKLRKAQKSAKVVSLVYAKEMFVAPWRGDQNYMVVDVLPAE